MEEFQTVKEAIIKYFSKRERIEHYSQLLNTTDLKTILTDDYDTFGCHCGDYGYECNKQYIKIQEGDKIATIGWEWVVPRVAERVGWIDETKKEKQEVEQLSLF